jgi:hyperosmotically inducible protein
MAMIQARHTVSVSLLLMVALAGAFTQVGCTAALVGGAAAGGAVAGAAAADEERGAGDVISDASITTRVKTVLIRSPVTKALSIDVDTRNGVVTLRGRVRSEEEKDEAVRLAGQVKGVNKVVSELEVKS